MNAPIPQSELHKAALRWAKHFYVFPVRVGRKEPAVENWEKVATQDAAQLDEWWRANPNYNIGLALGRSEHTVIDVDGTNGADTLAVLAAIHGPLPRTLTISTPRTPGVHYVFKGASKTTVGTEKNGLGIKIDTRSIGGYVLAEPSVIAPGEYDNNPAGGSYTFKDKCKVATLPEWISENLATSNEPKRTVVTDIEADLPCNIARASRFLETHSPAIEGQGGDEHTYKTAAVLHDLGISEDIAREIMSDWNERCQPSWPPDELAVKISHGYEYAQNDFGCDAIRPSAETFAAAVEHIAEANATEAKNEPSKGMLIPFLSSREFTQDFKTPAYLWKGILQQGFCYSNTARTGHGKTAIISGLMASVALGREYAGHKTKKGRVLMLVGENPEDVKGRWIVLSQEMKFDPSTIEVFFLPGVFSIKENRERIAAKVKEVGGVDLIVVDTAAAYFEGDDENSNTQMGEHARECRKLCELPGNPTVVVNCHPTKGAGQDQLLPRGGGSFIAEMDGNLTVWKDDLAATMHWQGKFRGPEFEPMFFGFKVLQIGKLEDADGDPVLSVVAYCLSEMDQENKEDSKAAERTKLLVLMAANPEASLAALAKLADWKTKAGTPNKLRVQRSVAALKKAGFLAEGLQHLEVTKKGHDAILRARR